MTDPPAGTTTRRSRNIVLFLAALGCGIVTVVAENHWVHYLLMLGGVTLALLATGLLVRDLLVGFLRRRETRLLTQLVGEDFAPGFITDAGGAITWANKAAKSRFAGAEEGALAAALSPHFAAPGAVLFRLQVRAANTGAAREDVVTRLGHTRLSVSRVGGGRFLWRLEEFNERGAGHGADSINLPMLTANKAGVVLYSNEAMRRLLGSRPKRLDRVFSRLRLHSGEVVEANTVDGPVRVLLAEFEHAPERREIFLLPVTGETEGAAEGPGFDDLPVGMLIFEAGGKLVDANVAARELLGLTEISTDDPALNFHELFEGLGRPASEWLADVASERLPGGAETVRLRGGGGEIFVQVTLRRMPDHGRGTVMAVLHDMTALKKMEAQFVQSQKMQAIGQLAGGIAHDFNNLLTAISGHCDLLLLRHDREHPDYADIEQIHQNANRAAALVAQLLGFSRKQTLMPQRIDLEDLLSDQVFMLKRLVGEKMQIALRPGAGVGPIRADRRQLEQVVMNLVINARDAMKREGTITLETEAVTLAAPMKRDRAEVPAGEWAVVRVRDRGHGIPPAQLQKIFEPFFTTKKAGEGTGLGLSMAYGIMKQSGGYIFADSVPDEGTTFQLWFPVLKGDDAEEAAPPPQKKKLATVQGQGTVLLVEDEAPVRAFAARALRLRGYTVLEADTGEAALETLKDPELKVDLFVSDVVMPGLDGPGWVSEARKVRPDAKVVFVSGYAEDAQSETQAKLPNSIFLPKPFSLSQLTETVQEQLA